jgi:hypothetical protein
LIPSAPDYNNTDGPCLLRQVFRKQGMLGKLMEPELTHSNTNDWSNAIGEIPRPSTGTANHIQQLFHTLIHDLLCG